MGRRTISWAVFACLLAAVPATAKKSQKGGGDHYLSPLDVIVDAKGKTLYVAQHTANQVAVFDLKSGSAKDKISLPGRPTGVALSKDGSILYTTVEGPEGPICAVKLKTGKIEELTSGHTPYSPVVSPDGKILYVCNRFDNNVSVIDLGSGKELAVIPVLREPTASVITPDGKTLFVANLIPDGASNLDVVAAAVSVIDTEAKKVVTTIPLVNGSISLRDICISPDGQFVYVSQGLARFHLPTTQLERGWMNTNALSIIDAAKKELVNTVLLDDVDLGAANPWGVTCTEDGQYIAVCISGTHQVAVIDRAGMHEKLDKVAKGERVSEVSRYSDDVPNDLSFLVGLKRRLNMAGNGPRGIVAVGSQIYVSEYFSDSLGVLDTNPETYHRPKSLPLGKERELTEVRQGELFFHDATLCFQKWQSCSSCHPDARADGLNWDLLNDGMGNPKNTKSLMWSHRTPPSMVSGIRDKAESAVRAGIRYIQFAVRPDEDAQALDAYLHSLEPVASPYLEKGKLSSSAKRGKKIFQSAGCVKCHDAPLYTNLKNYDVGTGTEREDGLEFDTPTLVENWRTGAFLYDGRAGTMKEVVNKYNAEDEHGTTSTLTEEEMDDLVQFVLSL